jgi:hypothetical protein
MKVLKHLTLQQLDAAAQELRCDLAMIMAVAEVEAPKGPFLPDGRPSILFERHWFHKLTGGKHSKKHPEISSSKAGGYKGGAAEWVRLARARELDEDAALMSASWGMFQILGVNHGAAGHGDVHAFVEMMHRQEVVEVDGAAQPTVPGQLAAFVSFIVSKGLDGPLRRREFATVAKGYNGPNYRINRYDDKMAGAFADAVDLLREMGWKRTRPRG